LFYASHSRLSDSSATPAEPERAAKSGDKTVFDLAKAQQTAEGLHNLGGAGCHQVSGALVLGPGLGACYASALSGNQMKRMRESDPTTASTAGQNDPAGVLHLDVGLRGSPSSLKTQDQHARGNFRTWGSFARPSPERQQMEQKRMRESDPTTTAAAAGQHGLGSLQSSSKTQDQHAHFGSI
jgi:hypothetical protein